MKKIAILASGTGTNAHEIAKYFAIDDEVSISVIISNKQDAGVLEVAQQHHIPALVISKKQMNEGALLKTLNILEIDYVVLAGFLLLIPKEVVEAYPNKIINIHPALLPKYGGRGMYGLNVHKAVSASGDEETGITIHYVNEKYDEGDIIEQFKVPIQPNEGPESIQQKVQVLEHEHFPKVIEKVVKGKSKLQY